MKRREEERRREEKKREEERRSEEMSREIRKSYEHANMINMKIFNNINPIVSYHIISSHSSVQNSSSQKEYCAKNDIILKKCHT